MRILIAGGTGSIGKGLAAYLAQKGHSITILTREITKDREDAIPGVQWLSWGDLEKLPTSDVNVVVNLCGVNINQKRWSDAFKAELIDSRVIPTRRLIQWANQAEDEIRFLNASAANSAYWGEGREAPFDEYTVNTVSPKSFSQQLVEVWEEALEGALEHLSIAIMRFGVVLSAEEGALKEINNKSLLKTYAILGSGAQPFPWIAYHDAIRAIETLILNWSQTGAFNLVSPNRVTQKQFAKTYAQVARKLFPVCLPGFVARRLFGEMADDLLLSGIEIHPKRLLDMGFQFEQGDLATCLKYELRKGSN